MSRYTNSNRLLSVRVAEKGLSPDIVGAVQTASLSLSTSATSQMVLAVVDPDLALLAGGFMPKRTPVTYGDLKLEVAVREIVLLGTATPGCQLTCRAAGIQALKRATGNRVWSGQSYTTWLKGQCDAVGLQFVGQPAAPKSQIVRKTEKGQTPQSTWDVAGSGATELGYLLFEAAGVVYFGQPTWLVAQMPVVAIRWSGNGASSTTPGLLQVPTVRDSDNDPSVGYTGELNLAPDLADQLTPGTAVKLTGVGPYSALYMVTSWSQNLDGVSATSVSIATPVNPPVQPDDASSTKSTSAASGYNEKTGNATGPAYVPTPIYKPDQVATPARPYTNGGGGHLLG